MKLTDEQKAVVEHGDGPALTIAVAGSGKTTTQMLRIARLVESGVDPASILFTTFSRLGASDMRRRGEELGVPKGFETKTIHAVARKMFLTSRPRTRESEVPADFQVAAIIKKSLSGITLGARRGDRSGASAVGAIGIFPADVTREVDLAKANLILPDAWNALGGQTFPAYRAWAIGRGVPENVAKIVELCYRDLEKVRLDPASAKVYGAKSGVQWDGHDDIILEVAKAVLQGEAWVSRWRGAFGYVNVDEAQDNSLGQWVIAEFLARDRNLMVVGDDSQAIYAFRGARPDLLLNLLTCFGTSLKFYRLTTNFRSSQKVIDAANSVLGRIKTRLIGDPLVRARPPSAVGDVLVKGHEDAASEATWVVDRLKKDLAAGVPPDEVAVLYRINATSGPIELKLIEEKIPYRVAGQSFFTRKEVAAAVAWVALALDESDQDAWSICWRIPTRFLKREFLDRYPTLASARTAGYDGLGPFRRGGMAIVDAVDKLRAVLSKKGLREAIWHVFHGIGVRDHVVDEADDEDSTKLIDESVRALLACADEAKDAKAFVDYVRSMGKSGAPGREDRTGDLLGRQPLVTLSTVHQSKGLEWRNVYVASVNDGLFPLAGEDRDDERRLGYVAFTRAKDRLVISWHREGPNGNETKASSLVEEAGFKVAHEYRDGRRPTNARADAVLDAAFGTDARGRRRDP